MGDMAVSCLMDGKHHKSAAEAFLQEAIAAEGESI